MDVQNKTAFYGYPAAKEAVNLQYEVKESTNPVLRGRVLVFAAWLCVSSVLYSTSG